MDGDHPRTLAVYSLGLLKNQPLRRALGMAGWRVVPGPLARKPARVGIWGDKPVAARGKAAALRRGIPLLHMEDAPLRSVTVGQGAPVMGLSLDLTGNPLDAFAPSDLETLLQSGGADVSAAAERDYAQYLAARVSKYNDHWRPGSDLPDRPFVLVVDQLKGDASIRLGGAGPEAFAHMLEAARQRHRDVPILIKRHPRAKADPALGHFADLPEGVRFLEEGFCPIDVLERAAAVHVVTSQMGFEAILHGHVPVVHGAPWYAGWGLTEDLAAPPARRAARHTPVSLFARAVVEYPHWFDVYNGHPAPFSEALAGLEARRRAYQIARGGHVASGMRLWKRPHMRRFLGDVRFCNDPGKAGEVARRTGRRRVVWASSQDVAEADAPADFRAEDGFLRSVGLGAALTRPLSIVLDDLGIYYDPRGPSRLEHLIAAREALSDAQAARAESLRQEILRLRLSKYNLAIDATAKAAPAPTHAAVPGQRVILVPGQVEDDASILTGAGNIKTNLALLEAVREENPDAAILYKPHPDVEAGLREGRVKEETLGALADQILSGVPAELALDAASEVWTMTSLMGFEALLRGKQVTVFGAPFYAGWGLTQDRSGPLPRRGKSVSLQGLVHAALIDYPLYLDPVSGLPCHVEIAVRRLSRNEMGRRPAPRWLSKLQGALLPLSHLWR